MVNMCHNFSTNTNNDTGPAKSNSPNKSVKDKNKIHENMKGRSKKNVTNALRTKQKRPCTCTAPAPKVQTLLGRNVNYVRDENGIQGQGCTQTDRIWRQGMNLGPHRGMNVKHRQRGKRNRTNKENATKQSRRYKTNNENPTNQTRKTPQNQQINATKQQNLFVSQRFPCLCRHVFFLLVPSPTLHAPPHP